MTDKYRVLVIEDDALTYRLTHRTLKPLPLKVTRAETGAEAIELLDEDMPDLILLDINLPDMRGWDVLDRFKDDARLNRSRVIVLTGLNTPVHRLIGNLQSVTFMTKPVPPDELRAKVCELLGLND